MTTPAPGPLSADVAAQLAQLRDIHLPGAVSWWPPAPGWWALVAIVLVCSAGLISFELWRRRSLKHKALQELSQLRKDKATDLATNELASELCILIRRVVLNTAEGRRYASTHGDDWSQFLAAAPNGMPEEIAHFIADAPYVGDAAAAESAGGHMPNQAPNSAPNPEVLVSATEKWIRRHA